MYIQDKSLLQGIFDDRGKYIYVTDEEMKQIASFINNKYVLTTSLLAKCCQMLIYECIHWFIDTSIRAYIFGHFEMH